MKQHNFLGKHHYLGSLLTGKDARVTKTWENTRDSNSHRENSLRTILGVIGNLGYLI
jgi:hypothetical protein